VRGVNLAPIKASVCHLGGGQQEAFVYCKTSLQSTLEVQPFSFSLKLCPYRSYVHTGAMSIHQLCPYRSYVHTGAMSIQQLCPYRSYVHTAAMSIQQLQWSPIGHGCHNTHTERQTTEGYIYCSCSHIYPASDTISVCQTALWFVLFNAAVLKMFSTPPLGRAPPFRHQTDASKAQDILYFKGAICSCYIHVWTYILLICTH
jgi:hypothetical protein